MSLIETVIAVFIVIVSFVGLFNLFRASATYVVGAQARETALSLGVERIEQLRAMPYAQLGTLQGIPQGTIPQNETVVLDGVTFNRRTLIQYVDDPADGIGIADTNHITTDYKRAKVDVSWAGLSGISSVALLSNFITPGIESNVGGGTLSLQAINAAGQPVPDASIRIFNNSGTSTVDVTTFSDTAGFVFFPGTPSSSGYQITVTKSGYSTARTYSADATNQNPNPGDLTVVTGQTTSASFGIDLLASLTVRSWKPVLAATTTDLLNNANGIDTLSHAAVSGGAVALTLADANGNYYPTGKAYSTSTSPTYLSKWSALSWNVSTDANTSVLLHLYTKQGSTFTLIPDSDLPGNAAGFSSSPVAIGMLSTSTYPSVVMGADLQTTFSSSTPQLLDWSLSYLQGPTPLPNIPFTLQGAKTIGTTGAGASIFKTSVSLSTTASAQYATSSLEWDSYNLSVASASGYDVSSYCPFQPFSVSPGSSISADIYLLAHTSNSLMVSIRNAATGAAVANATTTLTRSGFSADPTTTDACGNSFFPGISANTYSVSVSAPGYTSTTTNGIIVSGQSSATISL